jgi:hypothetical protein
MESAKGQWTLIEFHRSFMRTVISGIVCQVRIAQAFDKVAEPPLLLGERFGDLHLGQASKLRKKI